MLQELCTSWQFVKRMRGTEQTGAMQVSVGNMCLMLDVV